MNIIYDQVWNCNRGRGEWTLFSSGYKSKGWFQVWFTVFNFLSAHVSSFFFHSFIISLILSLPSRVKVLKVDTLFIRLYICLFANCLQRNVIKGIRITVQVSDRIAIQVQQSEEGGQPGPIDTGNVRQSRQTFFLLLIFTLSFQVTLFQGFQESSQGIEPEATNAAFKNPKKVFTNVFRTNAMYAKWDKEIILWKEEETRCRVTSLIFNAIITTFD